MQPWERPDSATEHRIAVHERMKQTIITEVEFKNASVDQVLTSLSEVSKTYAPKSLGKDPQPIRFSAPRVAMYQIPNTPITVKFDGPVSMYDALKVVCEVSDHKFRVQQHFIEVIRIVNADEGEAQNN